MIILKVTKKKSDGVTGTVQIGFSNRPRCDRHAVFLTSPLIEVQARSLYLPFFKVPVIVNMGWFTFVFFALVIVGSSNAVNLTDGLDGLAIGCTITVAFAYALLSYAAGNFRIAEYLAGAVLSVHRRARRGLYRAGRSRPGLSLVQLSSRESFHGRHRFARDRRNDRRRRDLLQTGTSARRCRRRVRDRSGLRHSAGAEFQADRQTHLRDVAASIIISRLSGWKENTVIVRFWILVGNLRAARPGHTEIEIT